MEVYTILLGAVVLLLFVLYRHLTQHRGAFDHLNIPIKPAQWIFGSRPFGLHKIVFGDYLIEEFKKYGKTFGMYDGIQPVISTIDPAIIKTVMVKKFENFTNTFNVDLPDRHTTLEFSGGEHWRALRKALSPTFTSGKLKAMMEPMTEITDNLLNFVEKSRLKSSDGVVDLKSCFVGLALDTISRCAFGLEANANENPDQDLLKWGKESISGFRADSWVTDFFIHLFFHIPAAIKVIPVVPPAFDKLHKLTGDIIEQRKQLKIQSGDFVARLTDIIETAKAEGNTILTEDILKAQGIIFFVAGFETTSNTLSTLFYHLAKHPDIQERLFEEVEEVLDNHNGKIDSEVINEMTYLDACIQEDLRMMGPVLLHLRECNEDTEVVPGFTIKKGMRVDLHIHAAHHTEEFFPEHDQFRPERFLKENKDEIDPYTYRPFGGGPRICIGQRFALAEMKITAARLLKEYRVVATPDTKIDLISGDFFLLSFPDMKVKLEKRS